MAKKIETQLMAGAFLAVVTFPLMSNANSPIFKEEIEIRSPLEDVWNALVTPSIVGKYHLAPLLTIELKKGGKIVYGTDEEVMISGRITEITAGGSLTHTFSFGAENHDGTEEDSETVVIYQLTKNSNNTKLTLTHSGFESENQTYANVTGGGPFILANMKKLLETKSRLPTA